MVCPLLWPGDAPAVQMVLLFPAVVPLGSLEHPKSRRWTIPLFIRSSASSWLCLPCVCDLERTEPCNSTFTMHTVPGWKQILLCAPWLWYAGPWFLSWDFTVVTDISQGNSETCWVL